MTRIPTGVKSRLLQGCQYGNPSWKMGNIFLFSMSVKVLPVTPLLNGVFVHRVFCAYFFRFEGVGVIRRFPWCTQENI